MTARRRFLAGDADSQGVKAMDKLEKRIPENTFRILWPSGRKDANDTLLNECGGDLEKFAELLVDLQVKAMAAKSELIHSTLKLNLVSLSNIEAEIQEWLWKNRIPKDALTNISGDADKGKSLVLYDLMARLSTGADMPDGSPNPFGGRPMKVILMFSEGSLKTTVKPRMMVMNANMDNVLALKSVSRKGETDPDKRQFSLEQDLNLLRQALQENPDVVLIGFDPITNYLGDKCNMNRSQDVRRVLTPLGELAEDCGVTVVAIIHFNKNRDMSAMHRTGGAAALVEVPRAAWCCLPDDDPEYKGGFVFVPIKNNLGKRVGGLRYHIEETFIDIQGQQASEPHLIWGVATEKTADDILSVQNDSDLKGIDKAKRWLTTTFADDSARESNVIIKAAKQSGITFGCLKKAREQLRMDAKKIEWTWYMRRHQKTSQPWIISPDLEEQSAPEQDKASDKEIGSAGFEGVGLLDFRNTEVEVDSRH
jgi:AAA domain